MPEKKCFGKVYTYNFDITQFHHVFLFQHIHVGHMTDLQALFDKPICGFEK